MEEICKVSFRGVVAKCAVCCVVCDGISCDDFRSWRRRECMREWRFRCQRDIPESVGEISFSDDDGFSVFENLDVVFREEGYAVIVA